MGKKKKQVNANSITENRKARHNYEVVEVYEAGLMLVGSEVKALREGKGNLDECYGVITKGEIFLLNSYIGDYSHANALTHEPRRQRKLLLNKKEIQELKEARERDGLTLVPLRLYWKSGKVKVALAIAKGRKKHDKRENKKEQDWQRSRRRLLSNKF